MIQALFYIVIVIFFSASIVKDDEKIGAGDFPGAWESLVFDGIKIHSSYRHMFDNEKGCIQR